MFWCCVFKDAVSAEDVKYDQIIHEMIIQDVYKLYAVIDMGASVRQYESKSSNGHRSGNNSVRSYRG
jgi:hypothetical protein